MHPRQSRLRAQRSWLAQSSVRTQFDKARLQKLTMAVAPKAAYFMDIGTKSCVRETPVFPV